MPGALRFYSRLEEDSTLGVIPDTNPVSSR